MLVTSASAGRLRQMGVCMCVSLMSVTSASTGRLRQMGVYVPDVSYIGFGQSTSADGCVYVRVPDVRSCSP